MLKIKEWEKKEKSNRNFFFFFSLSNQCERNEFELKGIYVHSIQKLGNNLNVYQAGTRNGTKKKKEILFSKKKKKN
jgi:hypothetical protein